jgi:alpha-L-arabinofuranosidase
MGRCVYTGIYEPGHPTADDQGLRGDVLEMTKELAPTVVRYPGGNFVSNYRWEDGVGPKDQRPTRLDLAWHSIETNQFGLHEFHDWATKVDTEVMMAVNLGNRGLQEACDLLEYTNHPGGTYWSDRRIANGAKEPFNYKLWCLGNEMDGPWQVGHKTAAEYGRLANETGKAMRWIDPDIELVASGSSNSRMPTFGSWESTVLDLCYDTVDYISMHAYYEETDGDPGSFLASAVNMDNFIDDVIATADAVRARNRHKKRINFSFDEWNVWYQKRGGGGGFPKVYTTKWEPQPMRRLATGQIVQVVASGDKYDSSTYTDVPIVDASATFDEETGRAALFVANRNLDEPADLQVDLRGLDVSSVLKATTLHAREGQHRNVTNLEVHDAVTPQDFSEYVLEDGRLQVKLPALSWTVFEFECRRV